MVLEPLPFAPRVAREGLFEGLADRLVGTLQASDSGLSGLARDAGHNVPRDLDTVFALTVATAENAHATEARGGSQSVADVLVDSGDDVDALRQSVLRYLPQPSAPIAANFDPPPDPRVIHSGRGLDDVAPPAPDTPTDYGT